jgi:hypothetical protein
MRQWILALVVGLLIGLGLGVGLSFLWFAQTRPTIAVALIPDDAQFRAQLTKNSRIKVVAPELVAEGLEFRKTEPELTRKRKTCQDLGVNVMVVIDTRVNTVEGKSLCTGSVKVIEVDSGALRWSKDWHETDFADWNYRRNDLPQAVADEVGKLIP